jgi:hypothetical protein
MVKYFLYIFLIFVLLSCNNDGKSNDISTTDSSADGVKKEPESRVIYRLADTALEAKITDSLLKLPFVQKSNSYIDSLSNHKHGISFISDTANNAITVMAGYNGAERFETYYNFTVNPKTFEIKVLDIITGNFISVEEYIKKNKE